MEVVNKVLAHQDLQIFQNDEWFKFSLDSVILCDFIKVYTRDKILDLGTGNGIIPVLLSRKYQNKIVGIELQKELVDLAKKTIAINNLESQIEVINGNIKNLNQYFKSESYDIVISNPPYFKVSSQNLINENTVKAIARHEIELNLDDLFKEVSYVLKNNGSFYLVHRPERLNEIIITLSKYKLEIKAMKFAYPKLNTEANMVFMQIKKSMNLGIKILSPIYIHTDDGSYTAEINKLLGGK